VELAPKRAVLVALDQLQPPLVQRLQVAVAVALLALTERAALAALVLLMQQPKAMAVAAVVMGVERLEVMRPQAPVVQVATIHLARVAALQARLVYWVAEAVVVLPQTVQTVAPALIFPTLPVVVAVLVEVPLLVVLGVMLWVMVRGEAAVVQIHQLAMVLVALVALA